MEKKVLLSIISLILLLLPSCEDFLNQDNPNKISTDKYFQNENDVLRALNGVYLAIRNDACLGEGSTLYTEERSDNMGRLDNQSSSGEPFQFTDFSLLPSNTYIKRHWTALYTAVSRANFVLTYIDEVNFEEASTKEIYKAEAKFLRALVYFHLVRKWGDVPLVTTYLTDTKEIEESTFREKKEVVYEQIIQDLKDALNSDLVNHQPVSGKGRASKAAVNALLGQVYLTMYTTLSTSEKATFLTEAKRYLEAVYNMRNFGKLNEIQYSDVFDVKQKSTCPEIIFQIVYVQGDKDYHASVAADNQPKGETINSQKRTTGSGTFVNPDLVKEFEENDLRKEWSVQYAEDQVARSWYPSKFRDPSDEAGVLGYGGNDWIIIRYADVMLMLAEAEMYLGNEAAAIKLLDEVRERAKMPGYAESSLNADYSQKYPTLKSAIFHERRVELAFENHRWFDMLRFMVPDELKTFIHNKNQEDYGISNINNFGDKDIYYPIPFDEVKLNPEKMYQNPGY